MADQRFKNSRSFILCILGVALNFLLSYLVGILGIPLYLDAVGTVITAALSGYIPGIVVGLITNILKFAAGDDSAIYYGTLNVLIAVVAAYATRKLFYKKPLGIIYTILACSFCGGVLGSVLTWFLYGFANVGITSTLAQKIFDLGLVNEFFSQFTADVLTDILDKTITILAACLVLWFVPDDIKRSFRLFGWRQAPLSRDLRDEVHKVVKGTKSLRTRLVVLITAATMTIAIAAIAIGFVLYRQGLIDTYLKLGSGIASYAASIIDGDRVDDFIENGHDAEGYDLIYTKLEAIKASSPNIQYLYAYKIEEDGCHVVFDLDIDGDTGAAPGEVIPFDEGFADYIPDLLEGKTIDPIITNDTYGWLLTIYVPVYDSQGNCACYACVDISMLSLLGESHAFFAKQISLFLGVFILILALGLWLAHYNIIMPVNSMAVSAGKFAYESGESLEQSVDRLRDLHIGTGDEIENLYHSFVKTSEDSVTYLKNIQEQSETISNLQSGLILVLADMVESRDQCTGDHVRKTSSYSGVILEGLRELGYYTDIINDEYISDVINAAPLHDIGKIKIPDRILNSEKKLNNDDFETMKLHTIFGRDIIDNAISNVPDSGYLMEAKKLAEFHHEKWDGSGYPHGIKGQEIPLSARVLAVADVFDALISKRSYKEPFSFEKAMNIIKEGSGTHFDPKVVEAFVHMQDTVKNVADEFYEINNKVYDNGIIH
ncbi:MAG: HD domain-containing protein [Clostridiales bacterium]|nr:HD domain-containing protein [Clostridiales bacterium]